MERTDPAPACESPPAESSPGDAPLPVTEGSTPSSPASETAPAGPASPESPAAEHPASGKAAQRDHRHSRRHVSPYRLLANLAIIFVALFLFVRVFAVEPFGVPTGSMAPALIGNHREAACPRCGYPVRVGAPNGLDPDIHFDPDHVACPNCQSRVSLINAADLAGDRLLVDKNVFNLRRPRRWEMIVFYCPDTDPKEYRKPYVKRIVGLPGESLLIRDGEVYANDELLRKGLEELRETRVLVFDMSYAPKPGGWNRRWLVEPPGSDPRLPANSGQEAEPAESSVVAAGRLTLDSAMTPQSTASVVYRHWNFDTRVEEVIRAWSSYDGVPHRFSKPALESIDAAHDFSFECDVEVVASSPEGQFTCRLSDGMDLVAANVPVGKRAKADAILFQEGVGVIGREPGVRLRPGSTYHVEFSFVDRRVILAIDGEVVVPPADLPPPPHKRGEVSRPLRFEARGCRLEFHNLKLYRDTYYTQFGEHGTQGEDGLPHPAVLGKKEYFVLGDNSGNSQDSRKWPTPGVPEDEIIGKPFLIHQPLRPGRMTIGGRERHYQTLDWSRLRWLH